MIAWIRKGLNIRYIIRNDQAYRRDTCFGASGLSVAIMLVSPGIYSLAMDEERQ
jgi:hypothetical protein